jgi:hypothetical protein
VTCCMMDYKLTVTCVLRSTVVNCNVAPADLGTPELQVRSGMWGVVVCERKRVNVA